MELMEAIRERRSMGRVKQDPVERETILELLEAANWAPSHHATEPWSFIVMTGEGRGKLGEGYAAIVRAESELSDTDTDQLEAKAATAHAKAFRAPVVIALVCKPSKLDKVIRIEELAAAHAATQNLLLAAHAKGLAAIWRSGEPMYHPIMKEKFQLELDDEIVALIYLGYPDIEPPAGRRGPVEEKIVWVEGL
ncbi:nitroreductase family protein [Paenibacillus daejeonensis]|uniref:nitroreductase family protein n=1 Tax=Paenibacillus daejeonensis TaxID=135193 RepID=UPI00035EAC5C|nr:nitroreductase [Paenibacillus daejeonensis]